MRDPCETCCIPEELIWNCEECQDCSYNEEKWTCVDDHAVGLREASGRSSIRYCPGDPELLRLLRG